MEIKRVRERIKVNGRYVVVHKETSADLVRLKNGDNVEQRFKKVQDWIDANSGDSGNDFKVVTKKHKGEFPSEGNEFTLYITNGAKNEAFYEWCNETSAYRLLSSNMFNISAIDGGKASSEDK